MRWIIFVLGLLLTPFWISYSFLAGSGPKVALIPPALVLVALVFTSLWKRLVVHIAGEFEPSYFHPHWGAALPSRGSVRTGLVAAAVSVCAGAIVGQSTFDTAVSNRSATRPAPAPQQKPQPSSTPLPQSILAAKPLGPASQFQLPSAPPAQPASGIAQQLGAQHQSNQPPSNQARGNQAPGNQQQVATPAQQQTAPQASVATPAPYAAIAIDDDHPASRRVRHPRKQATFTSNAPRYRDECRATGPTSMVHGQATRRSASTPAAMIASIILTANRGSGRTHAIAAARGCSRVRPRPSIPCRPDRRDASSTGAAVNIAKLPELLRKP